MLKKSETINKISHSTGKSPATVRLIYDALVCLIKSEIASGNGVEIYSVGTFCVKVQNPRLARNPRNGERVDVPEKKVIKFKLSSTIKRIPLYGYVKKSGGRYAL
jgi:nucleoid DNA-binding protein